ncbi:VWA domain-containing protein [Vitreimonas sp.]|uniref:VWA domain-containing protein n=1 Tax=Vitreimonas sp. TaxID=3069702 RepID=UPI002ED7F85F
MFGRLVSTSGLRAFSGDRRGNVAMLWAIMGAVLVGLVGLTVDFTRAQALRVQMQNAADGAALVAERSSNLTLPQREEAALAFFLAEMDGPVTSELEFGVVELADGGHRVNARLPMPVSLAALIRNEDWYIRVASEAQASASPPIEVALVLDNTGSMSADMQTLRDAAEDLADFLLRIDGDTVSVSLVPFVAQVNIGNGATQLGWMDTDGLNPHHGEFMEDRYLVRRSTYNGACTNASRFPTTVANAPTQSDGSAYQIRWVQSGSWCYAYNPSQINVFDIYRNLPASVGGWMGCVEARPPPHDILDTPPDSATPATLFVPYFAADEGGNDTDSNNWLTEASNTSGVLALGNTSSGTIEWQSTARTTALFKYTSNATVSLASSSPNQRGPQRGCPTPIVPLTTDRDTVVNAIRAMRHWNGGGTNQAEGLAWGWRVLSPTAPFTEGRPYNDPNDPVRKVIVMMTDGENTSLNNNNDAFQSDYSSYGFRRVWTDYQDDTTPSAGQPGIPAVWRRTGITGSSSMVAHINDREEALCEAIKATGIVIYTIQFRDSSADNEERLMNCATSPDHFYQAANAQELQSAFDAIGSGIGDLRITR